MTVTDDVDRALLRRRSALADRTTQQAPAAHQDAPLTFGQQTLWRSEHGTPSAGVSHFVLLLRWPGPIDRTALDRAVTALHERHPALRTTFAESESGVRQVFRPPGPVAVPWRHVPGPQALSELAEAFGRRAYRLAEQPPVRWLGVRLGDDEDVLVLALHHLVADAASIAVLRADLGRLYTAGAPPALPAPGGHVADVAAAQHARGDADVTHWLDRLRGTTGTLPLPFDRAPTASSTYRGAVLNAALPPVALDRLAAVCRAQGAGLLAAVTSLYAVLLGRLAGQDDVVVGTLLSARIRPELDDVVGYLAQPLPLRLDVRGPVSLRELVRRAREVMLAALDHQDVPFEQIWRRLGVSVVPGRPPLVQTMCLVDPGDDDPRPDQQPAVTELPTRVSAVDLSVTVVLGAAPACSWEYRTDLFDRGTVRRLHEDFRALLVATTTNPDSRLVVS